MIITAAIITEAAFTEAASAGIHPEGSREARPREDFRAEAAASPAEEAHADSNISHIKLSEQGLILFGSFYFPLLLLFCIAARLISNQIKRKVVAK